jgi:acyl carrier protein
MGLDAVELIMAVEEAFDIQIPDREAEKLSTVGQMYAFVVNKLAFNELPRCQSSAVFYQARRALMDLHGVPRRSVSPSTRMDSLLPSSSRRSDWQRLSRTMEAQLPQLEPPRWMGLLSAGRGAALLIACAAAYFVYPVSTAVIFTLGSALLIFMANQAMAPFAVEIPAEYATVGGTVRAVVRLNYGTQTGTKRKWDPHQVWETLRGIIAEQLGVPLEAVTADAYFVDNLGAD